MSFVTQENVRNELLAAIDDHNIPAIQDALKNYADVVQGVSLQIQARNLLARLLEGEADATIFQQMREMATKVAKPNPPPAPSVSEETAVASPDTDGSQLAEAALVEAIRRFWNLTDNAGIEVDEMLAFARASRSRSSERGWLLLLDDTACPSRIPDAFGSVFED